jgi:hypothetical protein
VEPFRAKITFRSFCPYDATAEKANEIHLDWYSNRDTLTEGKKKPRAVVPRTS